MRGPALLIALLGLVACGTTEQPPASAPTERPRASAPSPSGEAKPDKPRGEQAPDFTVTTFEGERFSLAEQRGTPVVLNFWESW